jgi:hypothetical protein
VIKNFFSGLASGLRGDLVVWLLLLSIAGTGWIAYGLWFKTTPDEIRRTLTELRQLTDAARAENARRAGQQ